VQGAPLLDVGQCSAREAAVDAAGCNLDGDLILAIDGVKVRRRVIAVLHGDHDPKEAADFRHRASLALVPQGAGWQLVPVGRGMDVA